MVSSILERECSTWKAHHDLLQLHTEETLQFIDITVLIIDQVRESGIVNGFVNIQTKHTTTAIIVNEHEPLLIEDMKRNLERISPQYLSYQHNDFSIRTTNLTPDEHENGHSHCKAMLLRTSETINIVDGLLQLGRWQRLFFIELDCARAREISVMVMGLT